MLKKKNEEYIITFKDFKHLFFYKNKFIFIFLNTSNFFFINFFFNLSLFLIIFYTIHVFQIFTAEQDNG